MEDEELRERLLSLSNEELQRVADAAVANESERRIAAAAARLLEIRKRRYALFQDMLIVEDEDAVFLDRALAEGVSDDQAIS
jgi:hypothetical protein